FLEGASVPEELIAAARVLEMPAMALLDRDGVYGSPRFYLAGKKNDIQAHIGAEITVVQSPKSNVQSQNQDQRPKAKSQSADVGLWTVDSRQKHPIKPKETFSLPILVRNRKGYQNLCRLITLMKLRVPKHAKPGECAVTPEELAEYAEGLVCLTGGDDVLLTKSIHRRDAESAEKARRNSEWLIDI